MKTTIIAIDPGVQGGIAIEHLGCVVSYSMPETDDDVVDLLANAIVAAKAEGVPVVCFLEVVGGYIRGNPAPGSTMFTFGEGFGLIKGVMKSYKVRLELVRPQKWQASFGLGTKKRAGGTNRWKNKLKAEAQRLFPAQKVTKKTADALLVLEHARRFGGIGGAR